MLAPHFTHTVVTQAPWTFTEHERRSHTTLDTHQQATKFTHNRASDSSVFALRIPAWPAMLKGRCWSAPIIWPSHRASFAFLHCSKRRSRRLGNPDSHPQPQWSTCQEFSALESLATDQNHSVSTSRASALGQQSSITTLNGLRNSYRIPTVYSPISSFDGRKALS